MDKNLLYILNTFYWFLLKLVNYEKVGGEFEEVGARFSISNFQFLAVGLVPLQFQAIVNIFKVQIENNKIFANIKIQLALVLEYLNQTQNRNVLKVN